MTKFSDQDIEEWIQLKNKFGSKIKVHEYLRKNKSIYPAYGTFCNKIDEYNQIFIQIKKIENVRKEYKNKST